jgi:hypothetical protein
MSSPAGMSANAHGQTPVAQPNPQTVNKDSDEAGVTVRPMRCMFNGCLGADECGKLTPPSESLVHNG